MTDYDLENMSEIERLKYANDKLKQENEMLKLDCESYVNLMTAEREKNLKTYQELEQKITHLSEIIETHGQSKEIVEILNQNIEVVLVSERELKVLYEAQQEIADRTLNVYRFLSSLSRRIINKMDEIGIDTDVEYPTYPVDEEVVEEVVEEFLKDESKVDNNMSDQKDLEAEELKIDDSERMDSLQEDGHLKKEVHFVDEENALYEERFKNYQIEIETLKDIVKKLTKDKEDASCISSKDDNRKPFSKSDNTQVSRNENGKAKDDNRFASSKDEGRRNSKDGNLFVSSKGDNGSVAALTTRLVMARLALGELDPTEAYKILQEANALGSYTLADLKIIGSSSTKKKRNPMKKLKRIFSTKKTVPVEPRKEAKSKSEPQSEPKPRLRTKSPVKEEEN